ncbi:MAG: ATP-dependent DNA ligase [Candidatus Njordarchaeota archaeon]
MLFKDFCELCEQLEKISERNKKISLIANKLREIKINAVPPFIFLITGKIFPDFEQKTLEISWATISHIITNMFKISKKDLVEILKKTGDIGDTIKHLAETKKPKKQLTLLSTKSDISLIDIYETLNKLATISGSDARTRKEAILSTLMSQLQPIELKILLRILFADMRHGVNMGIMEEAIAKATGIPKDLISRAHMILSDLGEVAQKAENIQEAFKEHGWNTAFEYKLDGLRAQIHKKGKTIKIFSRRLTEVTGSFPEIVKKIGENINAKEIVVEGEIIGIKNGKPIPFQVLMRRVRRLDEFEEYKKRIPVDIFLFDILYLDGQMLIDMPYVERRKILEHIAGKISLVPQIITSKIAEAEAFFKAAIESGHEGLMAKKPDSKYSPGIRGKKWLKIKKFLDPLDCVIIAAQWGYGRRKKWLSDYFLAVRDTSKNRWAIIGKTFKGLSDKEFEEITKELLKIKTMEIGRTVYVKPKIVVEVIYDEIQKSPKYESGYALRFARIARIRWDKTVDDADTLDKVIRIYQSQFKFKAKI